MTHQGHRSKPINALKTKSVAGWSSPVARQAHNLKVVGSNPTPATNTSSLVISTDWVPSAPLANAELLSVGLSEASARFRSAAAYQAIGVVLRWPPKLGQSAKLAVNDDKDEQHGWKTEEL